MKTLDRKKIVSAIHRELRKAEWSHKVKRYDDETIIRTDLDLDTNFADRCEMVFSVRDDDVLALGIPRMTVKPSFRSAVATYLTRVNFGLRYGKTALSLEDGEIRYEYLVHAATFAVNASEAMTDMVATVCGLLERLLPPLYMILGGVWTAEQAADAYMDSFKAKKKDDGDSEQKEPQFCRLSADDYICMPVGAS